MVFKLVTGSQYQYVGYLNENNTLEPVSTDKQMVISIKAAY